MASGEFVRVTVTCSAHLPAVKSFHRDILISDLADKLELITGVMVADMKLSLNVDGKLVSENIISPDASSRTLDSYLPHEWQAIAIDVSGTSELGGGEEVEFKLDEDSYAKRSDTARRFLEEKKLQETQAKYPIGAKCEVTVVGHPVRKGTIMFVGNTEFKPGVWIGVYYEEPLGKNDGSVGGKRYFECPQLHGGFVKPGDVVVLDQ